MAEATRPRVRDLGWYPDDDPIYTDPVTTFIIKGTPEEILTPLINKLNAGRKQRLTATAPDGESELDAVEADAPVADVV